MYFMKEMAVLSHILNMITVEPEKIYFCNTFLSILAADLLLIHLRFKIYLYVIFSSVYSIILHHIFLLIKQIAVLIIILYRLTNVKPCSKPTLVIMSTPPVMEGQSKTKTKRFKVKHPKRKLFGAKEPLLSVFMWGVNHSGM